MNSKMIQDKTTPPPRLHSRSAPVIERSPMPIVEVQGNAHIVSYVNPVFCRLVGKTSLELIGNTFAEIVPGGNECVPILDRVYRTGGAITHAREDDSAPNPACWLYAMWPTLDGDHHPVGVIIQVTKAVNFRHNATAITQALLIAGLHQHELTEVAEKLNLQLQKEITDRKLAEKGRDVYSRKLQVLSRRLVEVQETERRHLARELHDELGQTLTVAQLNLQAVLQSSPGCPERPRLQESLEAVELVLQQVRDLALNLRPAMLDDLGLKPALVWLTQRQAELGGLKSEIHADTLKQRLDSEIETECFRIAQEALTNVVRHAKAKTVTVELHPEKDQIHLCVRDDGLGFDVAPVRMNAVLGASLGLLSMEERAALAGGHLAFKSSPGAGTEVHAWLPLKWLPTKSRRAAK